MNDRELEALLSEQVAFYRADAEAYENWRVEVFERRGGGAFGARARADLERIRAALARAAAGGDVLELAAGTGAFTDALLAGARRVTAVDASPESIAIARRRLAGRGSVEFVEADLFRWRPPRRFDSVVFAYWLSHVPEPRIEAFFRLVDDALTEGGRVFFVDSAGPSNNPGTPGQYSERDDPARQLSFRELAGRSYRVVKVVWSPQALARRLAELGWQADIERGELAIWGTLVRRPS